jgi:hypothetical protein
VNPEAGMASLDRGGGALVEALFAEPNERNNISL